MINILSGVIAVLVVVLIVLAVMLKSERKKLADTELLYESTIDKCISLENANFKLREEKKIESAQKEKLVKKLADISVMSVDDIMRQLQNNG